MALHNTGQSVLYEQKEDEVDQQHEQTLQAGRILAQPPPGDEIVVTGMAGRFPNSDDVYQYYQNILNKADMVSGDHRRWEPVHPDIPQRTGKINFIEKFDSGFYGIHYRQAHAMDPMCRQLLERAFEAILDAGIHPNELRGTQTGVFIGACFSETEKTWFYDKFDSPTYGITGCTRSVQAQRISYFLGLKGPAYVTDTACSSSLHALEHAYRAIRDGKCDSALVGGASICLHPIISLQFARLGVLSLDGSCKSFDADANGYARSETISVVYLQKAKNAKRIYAQIVHAKANCDGYKEQGITFPSGPTQKQLLEEIYQECNVDPASIDFLEAHATGTQVGDPEEILAIDAVFCSKRKSPLYVGSIKSNLGHTEPASGMCSLVKVLLSMENNCLLPNINYQRPREGADALERGRMVVVTEPIPWPSNGTGFAAINSFGFGGANCHVVLKRFSKPKVNYDQLKPDLPRLVCVSGRTTKSIASILDDINGRALNVEHIRLLHEVFREDIMGHPYRGYTITAKAGELSRSYAYFDGTAPPLVLLFSSINKDWFRVGCELLTVPLFTTTIQKIYNVLSAKGVNVIKIITEEYPKTITDEVIGNIAIQIALVDILKSLGIKMDYLIGYSIGELASAYADDALTLEQTILSAYYIGSFLSKIDKNDAQALLNSDLEIADCNNNHHNTKSYVVSKCSQKMEEKVSNEIENNIDFQSKYSEQTCKKLLLHLKEVIQKPKQRSMKWAATFVNNCLTYEQANYASAEYFMSKLWNPVLHTDAISVIPQKSVVLVIGPKLGKCALTEVILVSPETSNTTIPSMLCGLGQMYQLGYNLQLEKLYPKVQWPVSVSTPMISPLIKWNHSEDWFVALYKAQEKIKCGERSFSFQLKETDWSFLTGHVIDGRTLFPATGYLYLVWETLAMSMDIFMTDMKVVFENVKFHRATNVPKTARVEFLIMVQKATRKFEVVEMGQSVCTGEIYAAELFSTEAVTLPSPGESYGEVLLSPKDIYQELKLRGYNYSGVFRALKNCNINGTKGSIEWKDNWIAFMDNMLQIKILQEDTRNLYVPTGIERLTIDVKTHMQHITNLDKNPVLPVYLFNETAIIKCGGIEIRGLYANSIARRKPSGEPLLETYNFIPLEANLSTEDSVRVCTQILLENSFSIKIRVAEVIDDATKQDSPPLGSLIHKALSDQPVIQPEVVIFSKQPVELQNIPVEDKKLTGENHTCSLVVISNGLNRPQMIKQALGALKENGIIISREDLNLDLNLVKEQCSELEILSIHQTTSEKIILLGKSSKLKKTTAIDISESFKNFNWLSALQAAVKNDETVIVVAQNEPMSGILGFVNCLRREPATGDVKCVFIMGEAPMFDISNEFYLKQLKKGLVINVFKDHKWGTYRHLLLEKAGKVQREHIFSNVTVRGDLSSLQWIEGQLTSSTMLPPEKILVHIYFAAVNFRDIMTASGRINNDVITKDRIEQYNVQGFEFCGRDSTGRRVMGMVTSGALASMVVADSYLIWEIPDEWSMEDAVTIPVTYGTVMQALIMVAQIKPGQSILIHAGSGGVGQAAITVALYYKCNIFTTVGTPEKREFIRKQFPQIPENHIGNSRDTSFEQMIFKETDGKGVDLVLNSLAEEKLQASVRCLAPGGKFLEIGKFDLASNNPVGLKLFTEGRSFHGIMLDAFFVCSPIAKHTIANLITEGLQTSAVKPLNRITFNENEVEKAFRYMAGGKHTGKVIINLRSEEIEKQIVPQMQLFQCIPRFYCNSDNSYIICGGLGGFGLELADWLVVRGAKKLVLVSRQGLKTGYQFYRIRIWKSYGVKIIISTADISTEKGCAALIKKAKELGTVEGIFNLAAVLKDSIFENQNENDFITSLAPKAIASLNLDKISREMCPELQYFVVFSSVSCGRGNAGQTNYGMANSIMERICEQRKQDGYPATAIQWGAIGDVGLLADMQELHEEIEIGGTLQQRITSCLSVLDTFLRQEAPIVSSIIVAEKRYGTAGADNIVDAVKNVMGVRDLKTISLHATLPELGMDSMMAVEIKQTLEREYEVFLTAQDIRSMTFTRLAEIAQNKMLENENGEIKEEKENLPEGINLLLRYTGDEKNAYTPTVRLASMVNEKAVAPKVFLLPGIEGMANVMEPLASNLTSHAFCLQYIFSDQPESSIEELAKSLLPRVQENISKSTPFTLIGYSFGSVVAIQLASLLEEEGYIGRIILIDGSPVMIRELIKQQICEEDSQVRLETFVLCALMQLFIPLEIVLKYKDDIYNCDTLEDRVNIALNSTAAAVSHSKRYQRQVCLAGCYRMNSANAYREHFPKLKSAIKLFKPTQPTVQNIESDYKLQELCENPVEVLTFEGNHLTIIKNPQVGYAINKIIDARDVYVKQPIMKRKMEMDNLKNVTVKHI